MHGKTAIVTGGASGLGKAYVHALWAAGCTVVFGDVNEQSGKDLKSQLNGTKFVRCDTTNWDDQAALFSTATKHSPSGEISYIVANAGVARNDEVFSVDPEEPQKPRLDITETNLIGTLYTVKLAFHYFVKQNGSTSSETQQDTCLVLIGSGAAFLDCPRGPQYSASKWAMRGIMHSLRRTAYHYGSRVNVISPWYVETNILTPEAWDNIKKTGVQPATVEDASRCLLHILGNTDVNGRSFFISGYKWSDKGYIDLDIDDYESELIQEIQRDQLLGAPVEAGLFIDPYEGGEK